MPGYRSPACRGRSSTWPPRNLEDVFLPFLDRHRLPRPRQLTAFREDRLRDRKIRLAGYDVVRIAPEQLDEEPEEVASDLRGLLCGFSAPDLVAAPGWHRKPRR